MSSRLAGIDALRVVAGAALLVAHGAWWLAGWRIDDAWWLLGGYLAMDVFLVSCGFLLALPILRGTASAPAVLCRALWRWLPLYLLAVLVNVPLAIALQQPPASLWSYLLLIQNLAGTTQPFLAEAWIVPLLVWSLPWLAGLCMILRRMSPARAIWLLGAALIVAHLPRLAVVWLADPAWDAGVRKAVLLRMDTLLYGVAAAWLWMRVPARAFAPLAIAGSGALLLCAWLFLHGSLDGSFAARIGLFTLGAGAIAALLPWLAGVRWQGCWFLAPLAASAYAGLLTHITVLRVLALAGVPLTTGSRAWGIVALLSWMLLAALLALLVSYGRGRLLRGRG